MITLKQNDFGIKRTATLSDESGAVDLTGLTLLFVFNGHEITPTIDDAVSGKVTITFDSTHTADAGKFKGEFKISQTGNRETIPTDDYIDVHVMKEGGS